MKQKRLFHVLDVNFRRNSSCNERVSYKLLLNKVYSSLQENHFSVITMHLKTQRLSNFPGYSAHCFPPPLPPPPSMHTGLAIPALFHTWLPSSWPNSAPPTLWFPSATLFHFENPAAIGVALVLVLQHECKEKSCRIVKIQTLTVDCQLDLHPNKIEFHCYLQDPQ